uniref:F-box domain-containing protein n=1 Tax=Aegilops tauschii TaxID=37682 RepID=R7W4H3_AEGTA
MASGKDRISALPDDLLLHVMSFLLSRDAVRTCMLARRWSTLWKSVPALHIEDDLATDSNKFMDELLRLRDPAPLNVCDICDVCKASDTEDPENVCEVASNLIAPWLRYALLHEVRVLRVSAPAFPTDLVPISSHLKRIELCLMKFDDPLDLSSCQVLDVLEMTYCNIYESIFCQSLRHLNMKHGCFDNEIRFRISAPNLVSLKLAPESGLTPLLDSMPSLVTASVESSEEEFHHCFVFSSCDEGCNREERFSVVLEGLSAATNLELTSDDRHSPILETLMLQLDTPKYKRLHVDETDERKRCGQEVEPVGRALDVNEETETRSDGDDSKLGTNSSSGDRLELHGGGDDSSLGMLEATKIGQLQGSESWRRDERALAGGGDGRRAGGR